jgi:hypothetical protein
MGGTTLAAVTESARLDGEALLTRPILGWFAGTSQPLSLTAMPFRRKLPD